MREPPSSSGDDPAADVSSRAAAEEEEEALAEERLEELEGGAGLPPRPEGNRRSWIVRDADRKLLDE